MYGHSARLDKLFIRSSAGNHSYYGVKRGTLRVKLLECTPAHATLNCLSGWYIQFVYLV